MPQAIQRSASLPLPDHIPPHPPAQKVAGRRMSVTSRQKSHAAHHETKAAAAPVEDDEEPAKPDYPRPAPPGEQQPHEHHQHEEEQPRKDKRNGLPEHDRRIQEAAQKKAELNRPSKDVLPTNKTAGIRISQPASKGFGV